VTALQIIEVIIGAFVAASAVGVPLHLAGKRDRDRLGRDHAEHGDRITRLETSHNLAFKHLSEALTITSTTLAALDSKLDALTITVAKSGGYETRSKP
jgi:hypothetical protein